MAEQKAQKNIIKNTSTPTILNDIFLLPPKHIPIQPN